jgi:hypothetical protein
VVFGVSGNVADVRLSACWRISLEGYSTGPVLDGRKPTKEKWVFRHRTKGSVGLKRVHPKTRVVQEWLGHPPIFSIAPANLGQGGGRHGIEAVGR